MKRIFRLMTATLLVFGAAFAWARSPDPDLKTRRTPKFIGMDSAAIAQWSEANARDGDAISLREQAVEAIKNGDNTNGFSLLQQAVSNDPREQQACMLLSYLYVQKGQPESVIATLNPIVNPSGGTSVSTGNDITTRMIYILALLDQNAWREAVTCYEKTWRLEPVRAHKWFLPGDGIDHAWPNPQFHSEVPDYAGLRAQAHLILGSRPPLFMDEKDQFPYMLEHLRQVLQINPNSLDANFVFGWLLRTMGRFDEARAAFATATNLGSPAVQKEIGEEIEKLNAAEEAKKAEAALKAAVKAKQK